MHIIKQIYAKADDVKLALLLLKMTPIANKSGTIYDAPTNVFFGRQLKAHLPVFRRQKSLNNDNNDRGANIELPHKYDNDQSIWIKLDPNTKWMPGKIMQVLPNQSYEVTLTDGQIFRRNETPHYSEMTGCQMAQSTSITSSVASFLQLKTKKLPNG